MELLNKELRKRILEKGAEENFGHFGSALSCLDALQYLYSHVLKKEDIVNDEAEAYLAEWITDQVYRFIKKTNHKVK